MTKRLEMQYKSMYKKVMLQYEQSNENMICTRVSLVRTSENGGNRITRSARLDFAFWRLFGRRTNALFLLGWDKDRDTAS